MKSESGVNSSALETLRLFTSGKSVEQIATLRSMSRGTISQHLAQAIVTGMLQADPRDYYTVEEEALMQQAAAASEHGHERLGPLHEALGGHITYDKLHVFRAFAQRNAK